MRPRGWHLDEHRILVDGTPMSGALVDFGLHCFHNAEELILRGAGPYFYLPKLENHREARLWNEVFVMAQQLLVIPQGTIRATVLIETITAAFEMEEILFELREHSAGLNAGRWDYLFSIIKAFRLRGEEFVLPDRSQLTMTAPFMRAYTEQLVRACHRRGAHAIGGMAAFVPSASDPEATERALAAVASDKSREAGDGFDGSWVAHPGLVSTCREAFDAVLGERAQPARSQPRGRAGRRSGAHRPVDHARRDHRRRACARTSRSASATSRRGCAGTGRSRSTRSWRMRPPPRSRARRSGSGSSPSRRPTMAASSRARDARASSRSCAQEFDRAPGNRFREAIALFREIALEETYPAFLTLAGTERYLAEGVERTSTGAIAVQAAPRAAGRRRTPSESARPPDRAARSSAGRRGPDRAPPSAVVTSLSRAAPSPRAGSPAGARAAPPVRDPCMRPAARP